MVFFMTERLERLLLLLKMKNMFQGLFFRRKVLSILLSCVSLSAHAQYLPVKIDMVTPVQYLKKDGHLKILSYIKLGGKDVVGSKKLCVDGYPVDIEKTVTDDSLLVWLPMIGEEKRIEVYLGKRKLTDYMFTPVIPADWGYFKNGTIHIIQLSHQDIAWMDTPDYCREDRIDKIIIPALDMMKEDENFTFEMEQTLNLMEFLKEYPERKDEVIQRYKEKRFAWGATYNQPYEGLSTGEQLVRQAYYGRKWLRENLGCDDRVANNMDVPGRGLQMPQILSKSGINNLFISRMREGLYEWNSPDGSKVLTFTPGNYGWATSQWKFFEKGAVIAFNKLHHRSQLWSDYFKKRNIPPHYGILMSCDATRPINYQKVIKEWNSIVEQAEVPLPRLENTTAEEYFNIVNVGNAKFEQVMGERPNLWLYIHGPAHYEATRYKRDAGVLLPAAETFTSINNLIDGDIAKYPRNLFDRAWMASIYPDHGLGGKNGDITDHIFEDSLKVSRDMGKALLNNALKSIADKVTANVGDIVVFNDLTWKRTDIANIAVSSANYIIKDDEGRIVPSQIIKEGDKLILCFLAENIPSLGYRTYTLARGQQKCKGQENVCRTANSYDNKYYKVLLGDGGIVSLYDKDLKQELFHTSKFRGGDVIEAGYTGFGAGEFTKIQELAPGDIFSLSSLSGIWNMVEDGSVFSVYENIQQTTNTKIIQRIRFYHLLKQIDFNITLQDFNGAHNRQYRITFPLNMREASVAYEVPMGILEVGKDEMKTIPGGWSVWGSYTNHPEDSHPREIQNFMSASGNGFGVTMASCVAVGDWIDPSREQADYPILQGVLLSSHKSCHDEGNWYHQTGTHQYKFSISSHKEGWKEGYHFGIGANHPLIAIKKQTKGKLLDRQKSFFSISDSLVALSLMKKADNDDNGIIIRLTEMEGVDKNISIKLPFTVQKVIRTNLIEDEQEEINISGDIITLKLGHHAIETFKLIL